jgi:uncharacterized protein (TIGR02594 family)
MDLLDRRTLVLSLPFGLLFMGSSLSAAAVDDDEVDFVQLEFAPFGALDKPDLYGYKEPTPDQKNAVSDIISNTPRGPLPIDVAESFITRFYSSDPKAISQWPAPAAWNPLVVHFFNDATNDKVNNDMVEWCSAFANWCIWWSGKTGSESASSQSFLRNSLAKVSTPQRGDLAVFTCFDEAGNSLHLGHVGFVKEPPSDTSKITLIGGNTSKDGHSSIICEKDFLTGPRQVSRTISGKRVPCTMRLNKYVRLS